MVINAVPSNCIISKFNLLPLVELKVHFPGLDPKYPTLTCAAVRAAAADDDDDHERDEDDADRDGDAHDGAGRQRHRSICRENSRDRDFSLVDALVCAATLPGLAMNHVT